MRPGSSANEFRIKSTLGVAATALVLLTPFAINNFVQGRPIFGVGSVAVLVLLAISAWASLRGRYFPWLTFVGLVPVILFIIALSIERQGVIGALWCFPALVSVYFMLPERLAWVSNAALAATALPQAWLHLPHPVATRVAATLLAVSVFSAIFVRVIERQQRRLEALAVTDPLTGLSNRMPLQAALEQALEQSRRSGTPMTLLAIDLDRFKAVNDSFGHDAGDRVLRGVGELLRRRFRRADVLFRIGGEEFLVLLYGTDEAGARQVAEELRAAIAALEIIPGRSVSASIGVATLKRDEDWDAWMKRADEFLYRAKGAGRNRVEG